ncbi:MAG: isopentenyl phosphate kinase [Nitrososphaerales archaeon]
MDNSEEITLLKLGGSLITYKNEKLTPNHNGMKSVVKAIVNSNVLQSQKLILVHGGGSFGHHYAYTFKLTTEPKPMKPIAISKTNGAMIKLHSIVLDELSSAGIPTDTIIATDLVSDSKISKNGMARIKQAVSNDLVPISFGYVQSKNKVAHIISGDAIIEAIVSSMRVKRVIFAMDVDGIYKDSSLSGSIIPRLSYHQRIETKNRLHDRTGGVRSKIEIGFRLCKRGTQVFYANGTKPERIANLLSGKKEEICTEILASDFVKNESGNVG